MIPKDILNLINKFKNSLEEYEKNLKDTIIKYTKLLLSEKR